ncbi:titin homolog [Clytia hemisphaerica]|uniref:Uncharacterized protein n=1 Tax=Clytia hemisphaerica TaxID=252671 RepID=A0A7M5WI90_9CNID
MGTSKNKKKQKRFEWLDDALLHQRQGFTYPQVKPSLVYYETPASLYRKVPVVPCPTDVVQLSTTKLGTKRYPVPPHTEFDVTNINVPASEYNFLHDPHLKDYLNSPLVRKRLYEKGLITKAGYVKCTIKEFNDYRQWVRKLKLDAIDQDWHLQKNDQSLIPSTHTNNEAAQLTKQRQERAKELSTDKKKQEEMNRQRLLKNLADKDDAIANKKRERERKMARQQRLKKEEYKVKIDAKAKKESEHKRYRLKILLRSKRLIRDCQNRIQSLQDQRKMEKEERARQLYERRQQYCHGKMEEDEQNREVQMEKRKVSINERENVYQKERRRSDVYMLQHHQENKDNARKHLEEASQFLNRIEEKKEKEIQKWRTKLKSIEQRERLLEFYRQKRLYDENKGKRRKRHDDQRTSVWDVDNVLLKHILNDLNEKEREELEVFAKEEDDIIKEEEEISDQEDVDVLSDVVEDDVVCELPESKDNLDVGLIQTQPSFITFGRILLDETENVYHQKSRHSMMASTGGGPHAPLLDIPGLLIEHCKSAHEHLPVVDSIHDPDSMEGSVETVINVTENNEDDIIEGDLQEEADITCYSNESFCSHRSSYEILVIPSRQSRSSLDVLVNTPLESRATLVHLVNSEPVLVTSAVYSSATLACTAQQLVQGSLMNAATQLGYEEKEILRALDLLPESSSEVEIEEVVETPLPLVSQSIVDYSKEITEMSLIAAAMSLGYDRQEISSALGVDMETSGDESSIADGIEHADSIALFNSKYSDTVKDIAVTAIKQAAINLGYSEKEADSALSVVVANHESDTSVSVIAAELAKTAIINASNDLGLQRESVQSLVDEVNTRVSSMSINIQSNYSLKSRPCTRDAPYVVVTHNALRNAALSLGFSEAEVNSKIGEEKKLNSRQLNIMSSQPSPTSEYLMNLHTWSSNKMRVQGNSYYECLASASEIITRSVINSALEIVSNNTEEVIKKDYTTANSQYELKLEMTAKEIVATAIDNAKKIVSSEDNKDSNEKLQRFALKYSMMIIGSSAKRLGYEDKQILDALTKDINYSSRNREGLDRHPSVLVKFNEVSISEAIMVNAVSDQVVRGRRNSIKERILTPLPSTTASEEMSGDEIEKDDERQRTDSLLANSQAGSGRERRLTPFFPESVQKRLIEEFNKENTNKFDYIAEEEDEDEQDEEMDENFSNEKKWSNDFMDKLDNIHSITEEVCDYSNTNESDMLQNIESRKTSLQQSDNSNETNFMMATQGHNQSPVMNEPELMGFLGQNQLAPGILALYNSIQADVQRLISSTNIALLASQSVNSSPLTCSPQSSPAEAMYDKYGNHNYGLQQVASPYSPSPLLNQAIPSVQTSQHSVMSPLSQSTTPVADPTPPPPQTLSRLSPAQSCHQSDSSDLKSSKASLPKIKSNLVELPNISSPIPSQLSIHKQPSRATESSISIKKNLSTTVPLPSVGHSRSVIEVQEKVIESRPSSKNTTNKNLQEKDSLVNSEEKEVVLKTEIQNFKTSLEKIGSSQRYKTSFVDPKPPCSTSPTHHDAKRGTSISSYSRPKVSNNSSGCTSTTRKQSQVQSVTKAFSENETPNYAKPLKRSVDKLESNIKYESIHKIRDIKMKTSESNGPSVFDRLSKHQKSFAKPEEPSTDALPSLPKTSSIIENRNTKSNCQILQARTNTSSSSAVPAKPPSKIYRRRTNSISIEETKTKSSKQLVPTKSKHASVEGKSPPIKKTTSKGSSRRESKELFKRSPSKATEVKETKSVHNSKVDTEEVKVKSSRKMKKKRSNKSKSSVFNAPSTAVGAVQENKKYHTSFASVESKEEVLIKRDSVKHSTSSFRKVEQTPLEVEEIEDSIQLDDSIVKDDAQEQKIDSVDICNKQEQSKEIAAQNVLQDNQPITSGKDSSNIESFEMKDKPLEEDPSMKNNNIDCIGAQLSVRELDDIPENEALSSQPSKVYPQSADRIARPQRSGFGPVHSAGSTPMSIGNISKVSLTFDDVAKLGRPSDASVRKQSIEIVPSKTSNNNMPAKVDSRQQTSTDIIYNQSINSMKPNVSSVKFLPSSANSTKQMGSSHSARSVMSHSGSRSGRANRSVRNMSKSLSVGSPRLSAESHIRKYSSTPFKESIPNVFDGEYESTKVPSINDVINRRNSAKMAASTGTANGVWVPSDSIVRKTSLVGENLHSPCTILSGTPSNTAKTVSGSQIFVAPATSSISFIPSTRTSVTDGFLKNNKSDDKS